MKGLDGLSNLQQLFFVNNKISTIVPDALKQVPNLQTLELGSNRLRVILKIGFFFYLFD